MDGIKSLLARKIKTIKPSKTQRWQDQALEALKQIPDSYKYKASIFKAYKVDTRTAELALNDCKELGKCYSLYFLKVFSALRKKV